MLGAGLKASQRWSLCLGVIMANLFLTPNSYSPILIQNPNFSSPKIKINPLHYPFRTLPHHHTPLVCALKEDSNPETIQDGEVKNLGVEVALSMLRFYKREISPILPKSCRYVPTCSEYSMEAYKRYGVVKGTVLTAWRLCRCNPLGGHGYDPPRWFGEPSLPEDVDD
ncbi:UPF0161 protein [Vigna angularis]|uniref:UPF0161 protein n=2 Tax=Phaseolus angularis TaxID=3914 RepID=A0A8T0JUF0_PHAAN|nr:UPF0161 protein At3g09310 [Vigna angularis]XP_052724889.1 UPF0161 protein At3g09310 [Vigna angularis]KAG2380807.1 UPF0161 protein [Vigna angularis]